MNFCRYLFFLSMILLFSFTTGCRKKRPLPPATGKVFVDLEGIWQENPNLDIKKGNTIVFYKNTTRDVVYYHNQDECYKKEKAWIGIWRQTNQTHTTFLFDLTLLLENGNLEKIKSLCGETPQPKLQEKIVASVTVKIPTMGYDPFTFEYKIPPGGNVYYPSMIVSGVIFYKTSNDPEDYKEKIDITSYKKPRRLVIKFR